MVIDHVGIVVKSMDEGVRLWEDQFGYKQATKETINTRQQVRVVFMQKDGSTDIKLIAPASELSPISAFARKGGGLHHLCFRCDSLADDLRRVTSSGARVLSGPEPGEAFDNEEIAFCYVGQGLNVEFIESEKRANLLLKSGF